MVNVVCVQIVDSKKIIVFITIVNNHSSLGFFYAKLFIYYFFVFSLQNLIILKKSTML